MHEECVTDSFITLMCVLCCGLGLRGIFFFIEPLLCPLFVPHLSACLRLFPDRSSIVGS